MHIKIPLKETSGGYALITVLFSLAIITILLTSASRLNVNHARYVSDQNHLANRLPRAETLLHLAIAEWRVQDAPRMVSFRYIGETYSAEFQDVSGLVDLNTASPALLFALLTGLNIEDPRGVIDDYHAWKREGYRLQRVSDFARVTGISPDSAQQLAPFVTLSSGRRGIAPNAAPLALLETLTGDTGDAEYLATLLSRTHKSRASKVNFDVKITDDQGPVATLTVHIPNNQTVVKLLEYGL